ncbi:MAG: hypothetical protein AAF485_12685, partial [Chloroflexota bacterium]
LAYGNVDGKPAEDKLVIVGTTQEPPSTPGGKIIYRDMIPATDPPFANFGVLRIARRLCQCWWDELG